MSLKSRIKGVASGLALGALAPVVTPFAIPFMLTGKTGGVGAGPALACVAAAALVVIGGVILVGGAGLATLLSFGGIPWYITVPGFYFLIWALIGLVGFGKEDKPSTPTASV